MAARAYAEARTQQEVNRQSGADLHVKVHIHSFPFIGRLLVSGEVSRVDADAAEVQEGPIALHALHLDLSQVRVDRSKTVSQQRVYLQSIGRGSASAVITASALSDALHVPVQVVDGALEITVAGQRVRTGLSITNGALAIKVAGLTLPAITIPDSGLLPCHPDARVAGDQIRLSCGFSRVPDRLIQLVNGVSAHAASP